jgi:hypothetical protein
VRCIKGEDGKIRKYVVGTNGNWVNAAKSNKMKTWWRDEKAGKHKRTAKKTAKKRKTTKKRRSTKSRPRQRQGGLFEGDMGDLSAGSDNSADMDMAEARAGGRNKKKKNPNRVRAGRAVYRKRLEVLNKLPGQRGKLSRYRRKY